MKSDHPISNSYWVRPGRLLAGEHPGARDDRQSPQRLRQLLEAGVNFFLDLTEAGEYGLEPYLDLLRGEAQALGLEVEHQRMPIQDRGTPTSGQMTRILDAIDTALEAGRTVYVHCYAGIGRTGTVVGCYLVRDGKSGQAALEEIAHLRRDIPSGWTTSPETAAQRRMVRDWPERR